MLKHARVLVERMDMILDMMGFHVVNPCHHQFEPFGATALYLLSESHCSVLHTFWEVHLDVFCCAPFDHDRARKLLVEAFGAQTYKETELERPVDNKNKKK